jgi:tRNA threonylcarbamoyl adenosine modification protein YeaZ
MPSVVLAIETSTPQGSVAVWRDDSAIFERTFTSERSHNSQLFSPLREALDAGGASLRAIVVGTGPASYTGVRIGIAAAQGLAMSRAVPVVGLPSVLGINPLSDASSYRVCGDARRGSYFLAEVRKGVTVGEIALLDADGLRRCHGESSQSIPWFTFDARAPMELEGVRCLSPSAAALAAIAANLSDEFLQSLARQPLEPIYLGAPFVTMPKK